MNDEELPAEPSAEPEGELWEQTDFAEVSASFSGPLPHPGTLIRYNDALPGGAERVFAMAEREQSHRHALDVRTLDAEIALAKRGQSLGTGLAALVLVGGIGLIFAGKSVSGFSLVGLAAAAIVLAAWWGKGTNGSDEPAGDRHDGNRE